MAFNSQILQGHVTRAILPSFDIQGLVATKGWHFNSEPL